MNGREGFDALQLNDERALSDNVESASALKGQTFVADRKRLLTCVIDPRKPQLVAETFLIHRFQEPGAQFAMNLDCQTNELVTERVVCVHTEQSPH